MVNDGRPPTRKNHDELVLPSEMRGEIRVVSE
jgi:hypothetical protein